jgi:2-hydroxy-6-oxonona-2,4-dienedioate hydrolase
MHSVVAESVSVSGSAVLVLVHGLGMSSRYWVPTLELLARRFSVCAPDLPGCGRSSRPVRPLPPDQLAAALVGWMDVVGIGRAVFVGHSIGVQVVAHLAVGHPDRVDRLVLASPTGEPHTSRPQQARRLVADSFREPLALAPIAGRDYLRAGILRMWRTLGLMLEPDIEDRLLQLQQHRCLVVRGSQDGVARPAWTERVASTVGAEQLITIPGAPHGLPFSAAPQFSAIIGEFAERARSAPSQPTGTTDASG